MVIHIREDGNTYQERIEIDGNTYQLIALLSPQLKWGALFAIYPGRRSLPGPGRAYIKIYKQH